MMRFDRMEDNNMINITIRGYSVSLSEVEKFCYLVDKIKKNGCTKEVIKSRLAQARR